MNPNVELKINPVFEKVTFPISEDGFRQLEANIVSDGEIYTPILTWKGYIVDGHNRYRIIQKHPDIKYHVREKSFKNMSEALTWIYNNQFGGRYITPLQSYVLIGRRYEAEKLEHGGADRFAGGRQLEIPKGLFPNGSDEGINTRAIIAKEMGVSPRTVARAVDFTKGMDAAEKVLPGITLAILTGTINPTKQVVIDIAKATPEARQRMAEKLFF